MVGQVGTTSLGSIPGCPLERKTMNDITAPKLVEVRIRADEKVLWVNVDGECVLRCCRIENLVMEDERKPEVQ